MRGLDTIVIGGGVVGLAIAYGLARAGEHILVLDEGDDAFRASRGNFGHVWVQSKGASKPAYARWSIEASRSWPAFRDEITDRTGIDLQLDQPGGLMLGLDDAELQVRASIMGKLASDLAVLGVDYPHEILGGNEVRERWPHVGPTVVGGCFCPLDGHVSPLRLLTALTEALLSLGGGLRTGQHVDSIAHRDGVFHVRVGATTHVATKLVLAAGLGNAKLAPMVGLAAPVKPVRGQLLITERVEPFLHLPTGSIRQTGDGGVQIGESMEDVGLDDGTTISELSRIAERAVRMFPLLANVKVVRTWSALRVMTADGYPIYQASAQCPGAFVVTCHSGVTLAAQHAGPIADWIGGSTEPSALAHFKAERFDV